MIDIINKPINMFVNCFYSLIPMIERYYSKDLSIIYSHSWDFILKKNNDEIIGNRIKPFSWENIVSPYMESSVGLTLQKDDSLNISDLKDAIELEIKQKTPIIITVDAICCPWTRLFGKLEYLHHILVVGYRQSDNKCFGYDALSNEKLSFDLSIFHNYFYGVYFIRKSKVNVRLNPMLVMQDVIKNNKNMIMDLLSFKQLILNLDVECEKQGISRVDNIPLILRLDEISKLRKNYIKVIEIFENINSGKQYNGVKNSFSDLSKEWERCKLHFVKLFLSQREKIKDNIIETVGVIVEKEEKLIDLIINTFTC